MGSATVSCATAAARPIIGVGSGGAGGGSEGLGGEGGRCAPSSSLLSAYGDDAGALAHEAGSCALGCAELVTGSPPERLMGEHIEASEPAEGRRCAVGGTAAGATVASSCIGVAPSGAAEGAAIGRSAMRILGTMPEDATLDSFGRLFLAALGCCDLNTFAVRAASSTSLIGTARRLRPAAMVRLPTALVSRDEQLLHWLAASLVTLPLRRRDGRAVRGASKSAVGGTPTDGPAVG